MTTILLSIVVVLISVAALAVGVIARGQPLKGSCGSTCGTLPECGACARFEEHTS